MTSRSTSPSGPPAPRPPHTPDVSALLGEWVNTDRHSAKGARRLSVTWHEEGMHEGMFVRAFGAGGPQPGDWGEAPAIVYTAPDTPSVAWSFSVVYDFGSRRTVVCAYHKTGILITTTATVLSGDGEGADHWARSFFHREEARA
ncbi:hypothetical protein ACQEV4_27325 [Streptomyces shenzhenensis]|uniref:hypothetical protein n=1 Tax=Streptomyces shenzhenensis TaxID=943815 RepID=UPI003D8B3E02